MEIERKYLIPKLPADLDRFRCHLIEQAYLCTSPVVRIRRQDDAYILTCKGDGLMAREECNLPLTRDAYLRLLPKTEGMVIKKKRYVIPLQDGLNIELDQFLDSWEGLLLAEVEFPDEETANAFRPPQWFGRDVTFDGRYHNSWLSQHQKTGGFE